MYLQNCPRCGWHSFEKLKTYAHCTDCNYFELYEDPSPGKKEKSVVSPPAKKEKPANKQPKDCDGTKQIMSFSQCNSIQVA
jgi:predicted nucleic-acid-binding Zn-ribbon protein